MHDQNAGLLMVAVRLALCTGTPLLATTLIALAVNALLALSLQSFETVVGLAVAMIAVAMNIWDRLHQIRLRSLTRQLAESRAVIEDERLIRGELQSQVSVLKVQVEDGKIDRDRQRLELVQLSTELLRSRNVLAPSTPADPLRPSVPPAASHVLIVEDEESLVRALTRFLRDYRFNVESALSVREAVAAIERREADGLPRYDFVLVDLKLPDGSGADVVRTVQRHGPGTEVIVTTGAMGEHLIDEVRALGIAIVLHKPYTVEQLLAPMGIAPNGAGGRGAG